jgi:hypothetical protein
MAIMTVIGACAPLFSKRIFAYVKLWLVGALLAPGQRPVTAALHVMGKSAEAHFQNYYRVLNRAPGASLEASRRLLGLHLAPFVPEGPVIIGIDEPLSGGGESGSQPRASLVIPYVRRPSTVSKRAGGGGSA